MQGLVNAMSSAVGTRKNDWDYVSTYKDTGISVLVCGKCKGYKECAPFWGRKIAGINPAKVVNCLCPCEAENVRLREIAQNDADKARYLEELREAGFSAQRLMSWTFTRDDSRDVNASQAAQRYVTNFDKHLEDGKGVIFYGTVGTGKTFLAACVANALIDKKHKVLMTNFATLVNQLNDRWEGRQKRLDDLDKYDLLIIDDLATERATEYMSEQVLQIVDARYRSGKPLMVTTNLTVEELDAADGERIRILSRISEMCERVEVKGTDRRRK